MWIISSFINFNLSTHCFLAYLLSMKGNFDVVTRRPWLLRLLSFLCAAVLSVWLSLHMMTLWTLVKLACVLMLHVDPSHPPRVLSCIDGSRSRVALGLTFPCGTLCFSLFLSPEAGDHQGHGAADRGHQQRWLWGLHVSFALEQSSQCGPSGLSARLTRLPALLLGKSVTLASHPSSRKLWGTWWRAPTSTASTLRMVTFDWVALTCK